MGKGDKKLNWLLTEEEAILGLKQLREKHYKSRKEFARKIDRSESTIANIESGRTGLSYDYLFAVAKGIQITIGGLLNTIGVSTPGRDKIESILYVKDTKDLNQYSKEDLVFLVRHYEEKLKGSHHIAEYLEDVNKQYLNSIKERDIELKELRDSISRFIPQDE